MHVYVTTCVARWPSIVPPTIIALPCLSIAEWRHWCEEGSEVEMFVLPSSSDTHNLYKTCLPLDPGRIPNPQALFLSLKRFLITMCKVLTFTHKSHLRSQALFLSFETLLITFAHNPISLITLLLSVPQLNRKQYYPLRFVGSLLALRRRRAAEWSFVVSNGYRHELASKFLDEISSVICRTQFMLEFNFWMPELYKHPS